MADDPIGGEELMVSVTNRSPMQSLIAGTRTAPDTWYCGYVDRTPVREIAIGRSAEWVRDLRSNLPDVLTDADGVERWAKWERAECIATLDLDENQGLRIIRIPYVPADAVPRPTPTCDDTRKGFLQMAFAAFQQNQAAARRAFIGQALEAQGLGPLSVEEQDEVDLAGATGTLPFDRPPNPLE